MSVAEIKLELPKLTPAERQEIANALDAIALANDAVWKKEMRRRIRAIKAGKGTTREELMQRYGIREKDLK